MTLPVSSMSVERRTFLKAVGLAAVGAGGYCMPQAFAEEVPWSKGTAGPKFKVPANAADCHHHLYHHDWSVDATATLRPGDATVADYRKLQQRLGTVRNVIVQPSTYGTDNRGLIESLAAFGPSARGIAVVTPDVPQDELKRMNDAGVRGVRFNLVQTVGRVTVDMVEPLSRRVNDLGWHVQFNVTADQIAEMKELLHRLPSPIVFDHLAHLGVPPHEEHPAFRVVADLLAKGRTWVKLSGVYLDTKVGPPSYADATIAAKALVKLAPERLVWGTDWPHPTKQAHEKPDDAEMFDLLAEWAPEESLRHRILVENPESLYGFGQSA